jgi:hypothetical protein
MCKKAQITTDTEFGTKKVGSRNLWVFSFQVLHFGFVAKGKGYKAISVKTKKINSRLTPSKTSANLNLLIL